MRKTRKYVWRQGHRARVPADVAGLELDRLRKKYGEAFTTEMVVLEATSDTSPLHPEFTWDDAEAGRRMRLIEAATMIRAIQVVEGDQPPHRVFAYVPGGAGDRGSYDRVDELGQEIDRAELALAEALRYLHSAQQRVDELKEALGDQTSDRGAVILLAAQALTTAERAIDSLRSH